MVKKFDFLVIGSGLAGMSFSPGEGTCFLLTFPVFRDEKESQ